VLADKGFPAEEFARLRLGVVVMKEELEYKREVKWMEEIDVTYSLAGIAPDGAVDSNFRTRSFAPTPNLSLSITSAGNGGWVNLTLNLSNSVIGQKCTVVGGSGGAETPANLDWFEV
jgi:acyl-CoA thioester hydrolase